MPRFVTADEAASHIQNHMKMAIGGFSTSGSADAVLRAIARRYNAEGNPTDLTLICPTCAGDKKEGGYGLTAIGIEGLVTKIITSRIGNSPAIERLAGQNKMATFVYPMGIFGQVFRAMTAHRPGILTHIGKYTFCDPRVEDGKMNDLAKESNDEYVQVVELNGKDYLFYKAFDIDVALIRGSYADEDGNITLKNEVLPAESAEMAHAVHNNGGIVIAQVQKVVARGSIMPKEVNIYNRAVDYIVVADPEDHPFSYADRDYRPELLNFVRVPAASIPPMDLDIRKVIARRGALELKKNALVNLGLGISDGVSIVANEEGLSKDLTFTIETGIFGGVPLAGPRMGTGVNAEAIYKLPDTFDAYDGGMLDQAFLSFAECDEEGNVNVSKFGVNKIVGPGGFINISQNSKKICFMATFTAKGLDVGFEGGKVNIIQEGAQKKFVKKVQQITFSGRYAIESGQEVYYVTERGVFRLTPEGLELFEIAPGVDLEKDILANMEFTPKIAADLKVMDQRLFLEEKMGLSFDD